MLGIDDGHSRAGGAGDDGGPSNGADATILDDGAIVSGDDSSVGIVTEPDGAVITTGCENVTLDAKSGFFVAPGGDDGAGCTQAAPCKTIKTAISVAHNAGASETIYVQDGTYEEQVVMQAGVSIVGGWTAAWARDCSQTGTRITAPADKSATVLASFAGTAKLSTLAVLSKAQDHVAPGESIYGIYATGASTALTLAFVEVSIANGGDGAPGTTGDVGTTPTGACAAPADGGSPTAIGGKGAGADAGWFDGLGFESAKGSAGGPGAGGDDGVGGGAGACVHCLTNCQGTALCSFTDAGVNCGDAGAPGCGGGGGAGGAPGGSAGSSVALFVADATVKLAGCVLRSGNGGNGGVGGGGGGGGVGSNGATGVPAPSCETTCAFLNVTCTGGGDTAAAGGPPGGQGGTGTAGGPGGDGAGGNAFAYVEVGGAAVRMLDDAGLFFPGTAGVSADGGNGASGVAGEHSP